MAHAKSRAAFDLLIVGASFAGLAAARTAAARGLRVAVMEAKSEPGARLHTTGILVREAIEEIDVPHHLTRAVPGVRLYAPDLKSIDLVAPGYAFYTTRTAELVRWMAREAEAVGASIFCGRRYIGIQRIGGGLLRPIGTNLTGRYLIGADGARSRVAADLGLGRNRRFLTGLELEIEPPSTIDPRFLHCFANSRLAPGYIGWIAAGPEVMQIGLAARAGDRPDLQGLVKRIEPLFEGEPIRVVGRRSGLIPCGGPVMPIAGPGVLLIGDAAGWVSPMTGGGIQLALHFGRRAASAVADHLQNGGPIPEMVLAGELPRFVLKRLMRRGLDIAWPNWLINLLLAAPPMRAIAQRTYFHRRGAGGVALDDYQRWLDGQPGAARRLTPAAHEM